MWPSQTDCLTSILDVLNIYIFKYISHPVTELNLSFFICYGEVHVVHPIICFCYICGGLCSVFKEKPKQTKPTLVEGGVG